MHVHRSVGQVTFVTCDMVLGAADAPTNVKGLLERLEPRTIAIDLTIDDLGARDKEEVHDPFVQAAIEAAEDVGETPGMLPYERVLDWAERNDADLHPLASRSSVGLSNARRIKRTASKAEGDSPEPKARAGIKALMDDSQVGPLAERRRMSLAESLTSLLRREPPRTLAVFSFPWGEMVSTDVRRSLGLQRTEGEQMAGGWPE